MTDNRIAALEEPFDRFLEAYNRAEAGPFDRTAMVLATATTDGKPSARVVLLKDCTYKGFAFHTNYDSRKGQELAGNPHAALCFYWPSLGEQVRVEGRVQKLPEADSDAYFQSRPRERQLGAWASRQSSIIPSRQALMDKLDELEQQYKESSVPRPPNWGGFLLVPDRIEFWIDGAHRLHDRYQFERLSDNTGWQVNRLSP